jgi:hypothetical protein
MFYSVNLIELQAAGAAKSPELLTLALDTLGTFNFKGEHDLTSGDLLLTSM